eukprot:CAMPEP_0118640642 /NCGR_PEP_ID=MMETSP0785-20121206/4862_1 /TAXON_ID=91992 /ORGANISM="Bolidomonas pacifica, Strain CCMP 1866" /LENGTH=238 /DNA_ID=CAMNT_0006532043 /DNA_START=309 /DNA_END=1022 /DNA_ORIENTATION=+
MQRHSLRYQSSRTFCASSSEDTISSKPPTEWDLRGLSTELTKNIDRTTRKLAKKTQKDSSSPSIDLLRERLQSLQSLDELLKTNGGRDEVVGMAKELGVGDTPPTPQKRGPKKVKGPKTVPPRLPFKTYLSYSSTPILVGRRSTDNDVLSTSPEYSKRTDWWMHASGCAGSHVVIKNEDPDEETIKDAATLAARASKCAPANNVKVTMTRWGNVSKPPGAKPGLVTINGDVKTVKVDL